MNGSRERDQSLDRLLRQSLHTPRHGGATDACLDAETLAAWVDGGLTGAALEGVQSHVADCARCQSLVGALARTNAVIPQAMPERVPRRWLTWLVPLTAAAAAVALWVAVPRDMGAPLSPPTDGPTAAAETKVQESPSLADARQAPAQAKKEQPAEALGKDVQQPPAVSGLAAGNATGNNQPAAPAPELRRDAGRLEADSLRQTQAQTGEAPSASAAAAPPAARDAAEAPALTAKAAEPAAQSAIRSRAFGAASNEIVSPDPMIRWRITGAIVERSTNGGDSWSPVPTGVSTALTAGAAPSALVCWLVGRRGVVLLSTDGRTWRRLVFPDMTDLSSVRASDDRAASVATVDGRTFSTTDGGATWTR